MLYKTKNVTFTHGFLIHTYLRFIPEGVAEASQISYKIIRILENTKTEHHHHHHQPTTVYCWT
jgi:uncharacterized RmlC-like cupin family protein